MIPSLAPQTEGLSTGHFFNLLCGLNKHLREAAVFFWGGMPLLKLQYSPMGKKHLKVTHFLHLFSAQWLFVSCHFRALSISSPSRQDNTPWQGFGKGQETYLLIQRLASFTSIESTCSLYATYPLIFNLIRNFKEKYIYIYIHTHTQSFLNLFHESYLVKEWSKHTFHSNN